MSFVQRLIKVSIALATGGNFVGTTSDTLNIANKRTSARVTGTFGPITGDLQLAIWGLKLSEMNQLSTVGFTVYEEKPSQISVFAGDETNGYTLIFQGQIMMAYADFTSSPDVALRIVANPIGSLSVQMIPPTSYKGGVNVTTVMSQLAGQMGLKFEPNDVSVMLRNPYWQGSVWNQVKMAARAAGINCSVTDGTLVLMRKNGSRQQTGASGRTLISKDTGMIGYPAYAKPQLVLRTLFNPSIRWGQEVEVQSEQTPANGQWRIDQLDTICEAMMPHGKWEQVLTCTNINQTPAGFGGAAGGAAP